MNFSKLLLQVMLVFMVGCASSTEIINTQSKVSISTSDLQVSAQPDLVNEQSLRFMKEQNFIEERGHHYLQKILEGYITQVQGVELSNDQNLGRSFRVKSIDISQKFFTFNFIDPGPFYHIKMNVDIYDDGEYRFSEQYSRRVNMAEIINADKFFNWLSTEERNNSDNQIQTIEVGLMYIYRDLYFKHFDISLVL